MSDIKLGELITSEQQRDAIHVAVCPAEAAEPLTPGTHVGFWDDGSGKVGRRCKNPIGIVDPFLNVRCVLPGQRFWMFLYPGTITSLRHDWTHPAFGGPQPTDKAFSERWLREYAERQNSYDDPEVGFQRLLEGLRSRSLYARGSDLHGLYDLDNSDELKRHAECYLGITIDWGQFEFSCSC